MAENQKLSLRIYSFTLRRHRSRLADVVFPLNGPISAETPDGTVDIPSALDLFKCFITNSETMTDDELSRRIFRCSFNEANQGETDDFHYLIFSVFSGTYGYNSNIVDRNTAETVLHKSRDQADEKEFFVTVIVPKNKHGYVARRGLLMFQEIGIYGVKSATESRLQKYFSTQYKITLSTSNLAPDFYLEKIFNSGIIQKIRVGRYTTSDDAADRVYGAGFAREERILTPIKITSELKRSLKHISSSMHNVYSIDGIDYPEVKMEVMIGNRQRTINLHGIEELAIEEILPDELLMADGAIDFDAFVSTILIFADEYLNHSSIYD